MTTTIKTKFGNVSSKSNGYYRITSKKEGNLGKLLHRLIWEDFYGLEVPNGYDIHHKDGNKLNNCILNLQLINSKSHHSLHMLNENNPMYGKTLSEEHKRKMGRSISENTNTSGFYRVSKHYASQYKQGFTWRYSWREDGKGKCMISVDINKLKQKVLDKGLEWREVNGN